MRCIPICVSPELRTYKLWLVVRRQPLACGQRPTFWHPVRVLTRLYLLCLSSSHCTNLTERYAGAAPPGDPGGGEPPGRGGKAPKDRGDKEGKDLPKTPGRGSSKKVPGSFVEVIDCLVDLVLRYEGPYKSTSDEGAR